jgi:hypothetical protein
VKPWRPTFAAITLLAWCLALPPAALADPRTMSTDHIAARLDDLPCEVYFFRAWTSYAHPVTPVDPMFLEQALERGKYQRAWMCRRQNGDHRFLLLETVDSRAQPIDLPGGAPSPAAALSVFEARGSRDRPQLGRALSPDDIAAATDFIAVLPGERSRPLWVSQKVQASFRYRYRDDGTLASVTITNPEGRVNVLEY